MLERTDIICISSIDWDFVWQGHQEIMSTLAARGNRVLFVENTGVRTPSVRDWSRVWKRARNWWRSTQGFRQERDNLWVYSPVVLPFPYSWLARRLNRWVMLRALRRWMGSVGFRRPLIWTFLPTPLARDLVLALEPSLVVYYCIDDLAASSPGARRISRSEVQLFREADLVFVTSDKLRQRASQHSKSVHLFPFGVNYVQFERVRNSPDQIPPDVLALPRPVVGYVGGVHQWVDLPLLAATARALPEATFALIGPLQTDVDALSASPNVRLLGARPHADVPRCIKGFDVAIVPYLRTDYTANVYPTKLNEYLAMGVPVVSTDLLEIRRFNAEHGDVVTIAGTPEEFIEGIRTAVAERAPVERERRTAIAKQNSWEQRIEKMSALILEKVAARQQSAERWDVRLLRLYRGRRRRVIQGIAAVLALYVLVFHTSAMGFVAEPLLIDEVPRPADAIVVFAGGVGESGKAGGGYQERVKRAVELYEAGHAPRLIFSSGFVFAFREAEIMLELAVDHGVPPSAIELETKAGNTYQNVVFVRDILRRHGLRRILLVSSPYHMRRARLTWSKAAPEVEVICVPAASDFYRRPGPTLEQIQAFGHEYAAIVAYWWRGWI